MTLDEAIKIAKEECKNEFALMYLEQIDKAVDYGSKGLKVQLSYFLANANYWRGENARNAKKVMWEFIEEHSSGKPS